MDDLCTDDRTDSLDRTKVLEETAIRHYTTFLQEATEPRVKIIFQALLEGIANIEAEGYKKLVALGATPPKRIFTAGGGSKNPAWNRIRERTMGIAVISATHSEACYGSALLARQGFLNQ